MYWIKKKKRKEKKNTLFKLEADGIAGPGCGSSLRRAFGKTRSAGKGTNVLSVCPVVLGRHQNNVEE